jgi:hypothetical protein
LYFSSRRGISLSSVRMVPETLPPPNMADSASDCFTAASPDFWSCSLYAFSSVVCCATGTPVSARLLEYSAIALRCWSRVNFTALPAG